MQYTVYTAHYSVSNNRVCHSKLSHTLTHPLLWLAHFPVWLPRPVLQFPSLLRWTHRAGFSRFVRGSLAVSMFHKMSWKIQNCQRNLFHIHGGSPPAPSLLAKTRSDRVVPVWTPAEVVTFSQNGESGPRSANWNKRPLYGHPGTTGRCNL